jgi:hypothetical protein
LFHSKAKFRLSHSGERPRLISYRLGRLGILLYLLFVLIFAPKGDLYAAALNGENDTNKAQNLTIVVNGRALTGINSSPQQRSGARLFLPIASIAASLGDSLNVDANLRLAMVRRQTGTEAEFDAALNQIRENGSVVLVVSNSAEIVFPPNPAELMLPVEIVSEFLGVSIWVDEQLKAVIVSRGQIQAETIKTGARHQFFELQQADYEYNLNAYGSFVNQNLILSAAGRIADGRFTVLSNLSGAAKIPNFRNGTFIFERGENQRFVAGDFGSGTDLQFMSATVRGVMAQVPVGNIRLTAFGGRSNSGAFFPLEAEYPNDFEPREQKRNGLQRDTNIFGAYATFGSSDSPTRRANRFAFSTGVLRFASPTRNGDFLTGSAQYSSNRLRLQADAAAGKFSGFRSDNLRASGFGAAADFSASVQLLENLNIQGRFTFVGKNFLSPQTGQREPVRLAAGGVAWQPKKWLAATISGSTSARPNAGSPNKTSLRDRFVTTTLSLTPGIFPKIFFSHTESDSPQIGHASFTLLNATHDFSRLRLFLNATRIKTIAAFFNAQLGANFRVNDFNSFEASQSVGNQGALNGTLDWQTSKLLSSRLNLSAGFGYTRGSNSSVTMSKRLTATVRLPRQSLLQVSYLQTNAGATVLFSLRGALFKKRQAETVLGAPVSEINSYGSFSGRVYQDANLNGKFDAGIDQPQAKVKVRVDGNRYVESNADGLFKIDGVKTGEHQIYLDLLSVRADLTLLDGAEQKAALSTGRDSIVDFRLVRTGRITGTVWFDANENGKFDENEQPLADVRVVAGNGRDTLTDENGAFMLGDLPPGEYVVLVDEKTLPEKTKSASVSPLSIKAAAGRETGAADFPIIFIPPEVKRFTASKTDK